MQRYTDKLIAKLVFKYKLSLAALGTICTMLERTIEDAKESFTFEEIASYSSSPTEEIAEALDELCDKGLLSKQGNTYQVKEIK